LISETRSEGEVDYVREVASREGVDYYQLRRRVAAGRVVIPRKNRKKETRLVGVGEGLTNKVNVNVGTSGVYVDYELEERKVGRALRYGADTLMDLSTGGDLDYVRRRLIEKSAGAPFGTVPTYQAWIEGVRRYGSVASIPPDWFLEVVERHLRDGVDRARWPPLSAALGG
jgi:phosphomethylpyrimidine synthase